MQHKKNVGYLFGILVAIACMHWNLSNGAESTFNGKIKAKGTSASDSNAILGLQGYGTEEHFIFSGSDPDYAQSSGGGAAYDPGDIMGFGFGARDTQMKFFTRGNWCQTPSLIIAPNDLTVGSHDEYNLGLYNAFNFRAIINGNLEVQSGFLNFYGWDNNAPNNWYYLPRIGPDQDGNLWAYAPYAIGMQLTSHIDPKMKFPSAKTSYSDPEVYLPISIHHKNNITGRGQIVDYSKMIKYLEGKMISEMGSEAGRLIYNYDLPTSECLTVDQFIAGVANQYADQIKKKIEHAPWIKVDVGATGAIPNDAVEEIDEIQEKETTVSVEHKELDLGAMKIRTVVKQEIKRILVPTGKKIKKLKKNWNFTPDGTLWRKKTIAELNLDQINTKMYELPDWVLDRAKEGKLDVNAVNNKLKVELQKAKSDILAKMQLQQ